MLKTIYTSLALVFAVAVMSPAVYAGGNSDRGAYSCPSDSKGHNKCKGMRL